MNEEARERSFDELARGLAENSISRGQAIKWAGYGVLGVALSSMGFSETAEALTRRQRRRCRLIKGGIPLERGECHCADNCVGSSSDFICQNETNCHCLKTSEGKGFCAYTLVNCNILPPCSSSSTCPSGYKCVVSGCCENKPVCMPPCDTMIDSVE